MTRNFLQQCAWHRFKDDDDPKNVNYCTYLGFLTGLKLVRAHKASFLSLIITIPSPGKKFRDYFLAETFKKGILKIILHNYIIRKKISNFFIYTIMMELEIHLYHRIKCPVILTFLQSSFSSSIFVTTS